MFKPKGMWNDGPPFLNFMGCEGAPSIASKHLCFGGGGGSSVPNPPDYSNYIKAMSDVGNTLTGYGRDLYSWAQQQGLDLTTLAKRVSGAAETAATGQQATSDQMMADWQKGYSPLYGYQRAYA